MSQHSSDPAADESAVSFLAEPPVSADVQRIFDNDVNGLGYVMNVTRLWAQDPVALDKLSELMGHVTDSGSLTHRQRAIIITSCASTLGDSYCALAWGKRLADDAGADVAASVLSGDDSPLDDAERALARWARQVASKPSATTAGDVQNLRAAGFDDARIFAITLYAALRVAFSVVNDALGSLPDRQLLDEVPAEVRNVVDFGRPIA